MKYYKRPAFDVYYIDNDQNQIDWPPFSSPKFDEIKGNSTGLNSVWNSENYRNLRNNFFIKGINIYANLPV